MLLGVVIYFSFLYKNFFFTNVDVSEFSSAFLPKIFDGGADVAVDESPLPVVLVVLIRLYHVATSAQQLLRVFVLPIQHLKGANLEVNP